MHERLESVLILCLFHVICKPLLELAVPGREPGIRMNLSAGESATPERGDLVEIFLPPLGLILVGFLGKRDMSIFQIDEFKVYFFLNFLYLYIVYQWFINCLKIRLFNSVILNKTVANGIFFFEMICFSHQYDQCIVKILNRSKTFLMIFAVLSWNPCLLSKYTHIS